MAKQTKKAKTVVPIVHQYQYTATESAYVCPSCHTHVAGVLRRDILRFRCSCGQELIVDWKRAARVGGEGE